MLTLASDLEQFTGMIAVGGAFAVAIIAIVSNAARKAFVGRQRELSRREIAAYIAEGTMSADDGAKLMDSGLPVWERCRTR